jgi:deoxyribodipyrimidine photolyase-related protein
MSIKNKTLRLILGDQLNINHHWFATVDSNVTYLLMEIRSETDYATHHIQKVIGIFAAMESFAKELQQKNHDVIYVKLNDENNLHRFDENLVALIDKYQFNQFEYLLPDEYRVDEHLKAFTQKLKIPTKVYDTEHFYLSLIHI